MNLSQFADLLSTVALKLFSCGAETRLIVQTSERIAKACGFIATVVVHHGMINVKVEKDHDSYTTFVRTLTPGINMANLIDYTILCKQLEDRLIDIQEFETKFNQINNKHYNPFLLILMIGFATGAFSYINGGSFDASYTGIIAGMITMAAKLFMQRAKLFPLFIFTSCGFIGTISSFCVGNIIFSLDNYNQALAMVVSLLLLIPGFPFINGILDLFKGYVTMGVSRLLTTFMLISAVCLGIMMAFSLLPLRW